MLDGGQRFAAKTGTAELGIIGDPDRVHAWMIGFAPLEAPKYAIAVVLTDLTSTQADAATGGREAGPVVKTVFDYLLTGPGADVELERRMSSVTSAGQRGQIALIGGLDRAGGRT